jgi:hypothetical protein
MITLIDEQTISGAPENVGKISLSRKGGVLRLYLKSPLLENYFRVASKGEVTLKADKTFGVPLYRITLDATTESEFLQEASVILSGGESFFGSVSGGSTGLWFNLAFLRAVGASEGIYFPIQNIMPLKLVENGSFAKAVRLGVNKLLKEFIVDFETELQFSYRTRVE